MSIDSQPNPTLATLPASSAQTDWWRVARHTTIALIGVFFLSTLRAGHSWGDDFAQYLRHADNLAHAAPYAETGYIYNPQNAIVGPRAYPPGYSAALAPVAAVFGANLAAYKAAGVIMFLIALLIAARLFSHDLSAPNVWICLAIVGFSSVFWDVKDSIMSEHLFLPLFYAAVLTADTWYRRQKVYGSATLHGIILGLLIYATCATRTAGIVLLPVVVVCEALIARRATRVGIIALLTAISLLVVERLILPSSGAGYLEQLKGISARQLLTNAYSDTTAFTLIWRNLHWEGLRQFAGLAIALLAAVGFIRSNLPRPTPLGTAMAAYFVLVVVWPSADGLRMILPLVPGFVFYVLIGMSSIRLAATRRTFLEVGESQLCQEWPEGSACPATDARSPAEISENSRDECNHSNLSNTARQRAWCDPSVFRNLLRVAAKRHAGSVALFVFSLLSFGAAYSAADYGPLESGIDTPAAQELFEFVRTHTQPDDVCLFFKPRALALYTGRRASAYPLGTDERELRRYADSIGASIIIVRTDAARRTDEDQTAEMTAPFTAHDVDVTFHNAVFRVYQSKCVPTNLPVSKPASN